MPIETIDLVARKRLWKAELEFGKAIGEKIFPKVRALRVKAAADDATAEDKAVADGASEALQRLGSLLEEFSAVSWDIARWSVDMAYAKPDEAGKKLVAYLTEETKRLDKRRLDIIAQLKDVAPVFGVEDIMDTMATWSAKRAEMNAALEESMGI